MKCQSAILALLFCLFINQLFMQFISYKAGILAVIALLFLGPDTNRKQDREIPKDELKNRIELSLPLTDKKLVIAHCMTNIIRYKGHPFEDSCNPDYYSPTGNISASLGGLTQVKVIADSFLSNKTLDEAVEFEMRSAMQSGIDGFQFYYTLNNDSWDEIIRAYLRVAGKKNIDFKFTFCISHPSVASEASRIESFARRMNTILDEAGRDNPHWLRTPDGRLILYMWYGEQLADIPVGNTEGNDQYFVAKAYQKLEKAVNEKFACVYSINEQISKEKLNQVLDYFPAVWIWTLPYGKNYIGEMVSQQCKKRNRVFTGSTFPGFYTSKLLKRNSWDMYHQAKDAVQAGIKNTERKYIATGLSYNFRKLFEFGMQQDAPIINIITWNDYPEGHHLAWEINHNDGFSVLLNYYKSLWQEKTFLFNREDVVIAFYKKYNHNIHPSPYNFKVVDIETPGIPVSVEDSLEVITILDKKADLFYGDKMVEVAPGLQSTRFAAHAGEVKIILKRNGQLVSETICPEWITDKPYRTDRLTYSFSNQFLKMYRQSFGSDYPVFQSTEYNNTVNNNNRALYKEKE